MSALPVGPYIDPGIAPMLLIRNLKIMQWDSWHGDVF